MGLEDVNSNFPDKKEDAEPSETGHCCAAARATSKASYPFADLRRFRI